MKTAFSRVCEREFLFLMLLAAATYFVRLGDLPTRGEETRRAQVAREMAWTGDWIVPRQQGEPFLSRPPLHNWLIAAAAAARGQLDLVALRWPTAFATVAATAMTYLFARTFLAPAWALLAGCAFAFCPQALQSGRTAECDMLFAALLAGGLFAWGALWPSPARGAKAWAWALGYAGAALATLVKGPQGIVFFVAAAGLFLLWRRELRALLALEHLLGVVVFLGIAGSWHGRFAERLGAGRIAELWGGDVKLRFVERSAATVLTHLASYPAEVLAMLLPWALLPLLPRGQGRRGGEVVGTPHPTGIAFLICAVVATFPAVWLPPGARLRYYLPLFPALAVLIAWRAERRFGDWRPQRVALAVGALATLVAIVHTGPILNVSIRRAIDTQAQVATLREQLPAGTPLASFGPVHHRFAYYYGEPIPLRPLPQTPQDFPAGAFALTLVGDDPEPALPFAWDRVAVINCDRNVKRPMEERVVVGIRRPEVARR